jgi:hydroxyacylglutathione hydrolase
MSELVIRQIPVLKDNYVYLVHEPQSRATGVVDPSVAAPILDAA